MAYINCALSRELTDNEMALIENKTGLRLRLDADTFYFAEDDFEGGEIDEYNEDLFMKFSDNAGMVVGVLDEMGILEDYAGDFSVANWGIKVKQGREFVKKSMTKIKKTN